MQANCGRILPALSVGTISHETALHGRSGRLPLWISRVMLGPVNLSRSHFAVLPQPQFHRINMGVLRYTSACLHDSALLP